MLLIPCVYEGNQVNWLLNKQAFAECKKQAQAQSAKKDHMICKDLFSCGNFTICLRHQASPP